MKGIYALFLFLKKQKSIKIGSLGKIKFPEGFYVYIGSAQISIEKRVARHFSRNKKIRWHIDYLLKHAEIKKVWVNENAHKSKECKTAKIFAENFYFVPKFGASDCSCKSHLFYSKNVKEIEKILTSLGFRRYRVRE